MSGVQRYGYESSSVQLHGGSRNKWMERYEQEVKMNNGKGVQHIDKHRIDVMKNGDVKEQRIQQVKVNMGKGKTVTVKNLSAKRR